MFDERSAQRHDKHDRCRVPQLRVVAAARVAPLEPFSPRTSCRLPPPKPQRRPVIHVAWAGAVQDCTQQYITYPSSTVSGHGLAPAAPAAQ